MVPHAHGGATDCANLCCLCRSHHRLETFARGRRFTMSDDGVLTVTTPSGVIRTTRPPGLRPPPATDPQTAWDDPLPDDLPPFWPRTRTGRAARIDVRAARGHDCAARTSVARCGPVTPSTRTAQPVLDPVRRPTISW